jgi:hypothetical protein
MPGLEPGYAVCSLLENACFESVFDGQDTRLNSVDQPKHMNPVSS